MNFIVRRQKTWTSVCPRRSTDHEPTHSEDPASQLQLVQMSDRQVSLVYLVVFRVVAISATAPASRADASMYNVAYMNLQMCAQHLHPR